jgi:hypothetical protein
MFFLPALFFNPVHITQVSVLAISLYLGFSIRRSLEYPAIMSGLLKLKVTVFILINVVFLFVVSFDIYYLIVKGIVNNSMAFMVLLDNDVVTTSIIYFCSMLYVTINPTIPIVHIILSKRMLHRIRHKIVEVNVYDKVGAGDARDSTDATDSTVTVDNTIGVAQQPDNTINSSDLV